MPRHKVVDLTIRMKRKDGQRVTGDVARAALWAAHKIAQRGGDILTELMEWDIAAIDWRNTPGRQYHYGADRVAEVLANMGGILEEVGLAGLRVAVPPKGNA